MIQVYLPHGKSGKLKYYKKLNELIDESLENGNEDIIVIGDFNAMVNPRVDHSLTHNSSKSEILLLARLQKDLFDTCEAKGNEDVMSRMTYHGTQASSRIDQI